MCIINLVCKVDHLYMFHVNTNLLEMADGSYVRKYEGDTYNAYYKTNSNGYSWNYIFSKN